MASFTITNNLNFPSGTSVALYPSGGFERWPGFAPSPAVSTKTVANGVAVFDGVTVNRTYFAVGDNGKVVNVRVPSGTDYVPVVTGDRDDPEGALKNVLAGLDEAGVIVDQSVAGG